jgi:pimeloyl-ACP methyl ester carboxylesterase
MPVATNATDGSRVYFEDDRGAGSPVVFLGGFLDPIELARRSPLAQALQERSDEFRLIFVDHRGHGRSDKPHDARAYAMPLRVADVVAVLDALDIGRAHVVCMSWGGRLCFGIGERAPERVRSLVMVGQQPFAIDPSGPLTHAVGEALAASRREGIEALVCAFEAIAGRYPDDVRELYLANDPEAMRAAFAAALAEGAVAGALRTWRIRCLIAAARDDADFYDQARRAADEIPNAEFLSLEGMDHLGVDMAGVEPLLPAVLRTFREAT